MAEGDDFERRLLVAVDAKGYGGGTARKHREVQRALLSGMEDAAERAGLRRDQWQRQGAGDGELAVLPRDVPETRVVDDYVRHLHAALRRYNRGRMGQARLRLRLAIHYGTAIPGVNGYEGGGPVKVARLCDSRSLKAALEASGADLVVALSDQVFRDVVKEELTSLEPEDFRGVRVVEKEHDEVAWLWVPGGDVHALELPSDDGPDDPPRGANRPSGTPADVSRPEPGSPPAEPDSPTPEPGRRRPEPDSPASAQRSVSNSFHGPVTVQDGVFGFKGH